MTPAAKPAIFLPPMSIGAAAPTIECVELAVSEIMMRMPQPVKIPAGVGPTSPFISSIAAKPMTTASRKYSDMATGERWPLQNRSETQPEASEPATAAMGMMANVHATVAGMLVFMSICN